MTAELYAATSAFKRKKEKKEDKACAEVAGKKKSRGNECRRERKIRHAPPGSTHEIIGSRESTSARRWIKPRASPIDSTPGIHRSTPFPLALSIILLCFQAVAKNPGGVLE